MPPEYFFPMLGMAFALAWGVLATVRGYAKEKFKAERENPTVGLLEAERLAALETRVHELEERLDFAERVLTQSKQGQLNAGGEPEP